MMMAEVDMTNSDAIERRMGELRHEYQKRMKELHKLTPRPSGRPSHASLMLVHNSVADYIHATEKMQDEISESNEESSESPGQEQAPPSPRVLKRTTRHARHLEEQQELLMQQQINQQVQNREEGEQEAPQQPPQADSQTDFVVPSRPTRPRREKVPPPLASLPTATQASQSNPVPMDHGSGGDDSRHSSSFVDLGSKEKRSPTKQVMVNKYQLETHILADGEELYPCPWPGCNKVFDRVKSRSAHLKWHGGAYAKVQQKSGSRMLESDELDEDLDDDDEEEDEDEEAVEEEDEENEEDGEDAGNTGPASKAMEDEDQDEDIEEDAASDSVTHQDKRLKRKNQYSAPQSTSRRNTGPPGSHSLPKVALFEVGDKVSLLPSFSNQFRSLSGGQLGQIEAIVNPLAPADAREYRVVPMKTRSSRPLVIPGHALVMESRAVDDETSSKLHQESSDREDDAGQSLDDSVDEQRETGILQAGLDTNLVDSGSTSQGVKNQSRETKLTSSSKPLSTSKRNISFEKVDEVNSNDASSSSVDPSTPTQRPRRHSRPSESANDLGSNDELPSTEEKPLPLKHAGPPRSTEFFASGDVVLFLDPATKQNIFTRGKILSIVNNSRDGKPGAYSIHADNDSRALVVDSQYVYPDIAPKLTHLRKGVRVVALYGLDSHMYAPGTVTRVEPSSNKARVVLDDESLQHLLWRKLPEIRMIPSLE